MIIFIVLMQSYISHFRDNVIILVSLNQEEQNQSKKMRIILSVPVHPTCLLFGRYIKRKDPLHSSHNA